MLVDIVLNNDVRRSIHLTQRQVVTDMCQRSFQETKFGHDQDFE